MREFLLLGDLGQDREPSSEYLQQLGFDHIDHGFKLEKQNMSKAKSPSSDKTIATLSQGRRTNTSEGINDRTKDHAPSPVAQSSP
jgi:hypothetical protein